MNTYGTRQTLIQRLQENPNDQSWEEFTQFYSGYIYVIIRNANLSHHDAEDLMQQSLLKCWKGLSSFTYEPEKTRFRSWLCTVVKNTIRSFLKLKSTKMSQYSQNEMIEERNYLENVCLPEIDRVAEREWENYIANMAMQVIKTRFSPQVTRAFELFCEGKAAQEVSEELELPINTVHVYKKRVQNALYKEIVRLDHDLS